MRRVLIVVSADYGELGNALLFAAGSNDQLQVRMLLPANCQGRIDSDGPVEVQYFASRRTLAHHVVTFRPDAVLMFSGYLLSMTRCLSLPDMCLLLRFIRHQGIPVMTTDPFDGLLSRAGELSLSVLASGERKTWRSLLLAIDLKLHFRVLHRLLRDAPQLYPARDSSRPWCYYNPHWRALVKDEASVDGKQGESWLFVLSEADLRIQSHAAGLDTFADTLLGHLLMIERPDRYVTLIAPERLLKRLQERAPNLTCTCLGQIPFPDFLDLLTTADKAFYWNLFSFSILFRLLLGKPTLFFHRGHMAEIMPGLLDSGIKLYYQGWSPPLLALGAPPSDTELARLSADFTMHARRIHAEMRESPTPASLIERLLHTHSGR